MPPPEYHPAAAVAKVAPGRWGVAVSGGADSVALLRLCASRDDLTLHVLHVDHQTRGDASTADAAFVVDLAGSLGLEQTRRTREQIEASLDADVRASLPSNPSSRYRALRLAMYRDAASAHQLQGVLLAHHADDQAETVLLRLLRGAGYAALAGIAETSHIAGVLLHRPLLCVRRGALREYLVSIDQPWREDASNETGQYARNRVRMALAGRDDLRTSVLDVADRARRLSAWVKSTAPELPSSFELHTVSDLPEVLARGALADWLMRADVPAEEVTPAHVEQMLSMCHDAASASQVDFPGGVRVNRRRGRIASTVRSTPARAPTPVRAPDA